MFLFCIPDAHHGFIIRLGHRNKELMGSCNRRYNLAVWDDDLLVDKLFIFKLIDVELGIPGADVDSSSKKAKATEILFLEGETDFWNLKEDGWVFILNFVEFQLWKLIGHCHDFYYDYELLILEYLNHFFSLSLMTVYTPYPLQTTTPRKVQVFPSSNKVKNRMLIKIRQVIVMQYLRRVSPSMW